MYKLVKTMYTSDILTALLFNEDYVPLPNTTLNEKFDIALSKQEETTIIPELKYLVLGNGNVSSFGDASSTEINLAYANHLVKDGALYNHIPFVVRTLSNDLTAAERTVYRLRVTKTIGGTEYVAYFGKVMNNNTDSRSVNEVVVNSDGSRTISTFNTNDPTILSPVFQETHGDITVDSSKYVVVTRTANITLTAEEIVSIKEGIDIWYSEGTAEERSHYITEIGLCTGNDVTTDEGYDEAIVTQLAFILETSSEYDLDVAIANDEGITRNIDLGGMEPYAVR